MKMTLYTEKGSITTKTAFGDCDAIGWSVLDGSVIFRATVTKFSIAKGLIRRYCKIVTGNGEDYKPTVYRTFNNGLSQSY